VGLPNQYRGYGLGVALICVRDSEMQARDRAMLCAGRQCRGRSEEREVAAPAAPMPGQPLPPPQPPQRPAGRFPQEVSFPVTAFFRFDGDVADLGTRRSGRLELYNPLTIQAVSIHGRRVPLETDLTTPLAYFLSRSDLEGIEYTGLLRADKI